MRTLTCCALVALALAVSPLAAGACRPNAPCYSAESIVNAASNVAGDPIAPYTWVSLYGTGLSFSARNRTAEDMLPGFGGVNVLVNNQPALLSYISPLQVNFLVPFSITSPEAKIQVTREGTAGPEVIVKLSDCSPALFQMDAGTVVAADPSNPERYTVITHENPSRANDIVILYATGLGPFLYPMDDNLAELPLTANPIARTPAFRLLLNDEPVDDRLVEYVGAAPGFIGVYQINLRLPNPVPVNPEIRIGFGEHLSPFGIHLLAR
ncbi:MAG: hypothetical protein ACM336_05400 [Acidobacteriota bacterium]